MSFYDIKRISYDRLTQRMVTDRPYKDSANAYPLGDRKYSDRHYRHELDGRFTIWYADRETVDNKYGRANDKQGNYANSNGFYEKRMIGVVHPDNGFEFTGYSGQGENMLLSRGLAAYIHHDKSKGGLVYETTKIGGGKLMHPVFRGLRINCDTGEAMTDYETFLPKVKRKQAAEVMKEYDEFMSVFETMVKAMDDKGIWEVYVDLYIHQANGREDTWRSMDVGIVRRLITERKYVDAGCLFTMLSKMSNMRWRTEWIMNDSNGTGVIANPSGGRISGQLLHTAWREKAINDVRTNFRRMILREHPGVFDFEKLERGAPLPASQWGLLIQVDGNPVIRL